MLIKKPVIALAAGALLVAAGALPAAAQYAGGDCTDMYNRTMAAYQGYGPQSPQYAELLNHYNGRCLSGSSAAPASSYGDAQPYYAQPYYAQPVDPGAAIVGGIIGGALSGALGDDRGDWRGDRYGYRHGDYRRRF